RVSGNVEADEIADVVEPSRSLEHGQTRSTRRQVRRHDDEGSPIRQASQQRAIGDRLLQRVRPDQSRPCALNASLVFEPDTPSSPTDRDTINFNTARRQQQPAFEFEPVVTKQLVALFGELATLDSAGGLEAHRSRSSKILATRTSS